MKITQCVIDSELLIKFISKDSDLDNKELKCFLDILKLINEDKCKIGLNKEIRSEYIQIVKNYSQTYIGHLIWNIIGNRGCSEKIMKKFAHDKNDQLRRATLESKIPYITAAHYLEKNNIIVSTNKYINDKYIKCVTHLMDAEVICKDACETMNEINME